MKKNTFDAFRKASLGGSVAAAAGASLCCTGPLVAFLFGASGFASAGFFSRWRPVLLTIAFAFLVLAWFLTGRKPTTACADGGCAKTSPFARSKVTLWIATASVLVAAGFSSAVLSAKQGANCCATGGSCETGTVALQLKTPANEKLDPKLVSLYRVPMVCPAAPQIGCGSASKPILLGLEKDNGVSQAWLNRAGTIMAVVWAAQTSVEQRTGSIAGLQQRTQMTFNELAGRERQQALADLQSGSGWYRGADVDRLSEEEAGIIAARLVRRVRARTAISQEKASGLQRAVADALKKRFTDDKVKQEQNALLKTEDGLQRAAGSFLEKDQVRLLKEAIAAGLRPLPGEQ